MQVAWPLLGPVRWLRYVNKEVKVKAGPDEERTGWLLTVDPVSASLVLVNFRAEGGATVQVVMGHAVEEVQVLQEADEETTERLQTSFLPPETSSRLDPQELRTRRRGVRSWLEKNRIPVEEDGDELRVASGVLIIRAPYGPEDCYSANQIILDRIQKLIQSLVQQDHSEPDPESDPAPSRN
ncbi:gem-associated protein 6 isoform X2 [Sebastes umbrosus]|uniref:gem-associated protein 6 isoform X1 n=1 Tax=Sebastes umbrosus TaxID=72105 RepID=UPI00189C8903|nr:gem-associated protein 6 isoform X1 [Sebastes umbrosus]XP_037613221.1 gem-associated protein 6 isoform X1 [Sebastes umbrosus]XP_037613222.1 gem-associated protein 6 isoform X1 [Sebastes umbrosus]XP_037613223.1 gem-associated protein 6 isoform X1 [Sebastes umbrosus]XP_037613224.1 gem-associated protein 6 isoform X1 [Sebastes umbrosus]XP_037613225.1 gem-associated protein 6 isoform X1 [Sebastes umbrosus]XP_037613226.1 gem-associated protein 6 isoform X2 [Sebastes umbrosus]